MNDAPNASEPTVSVIIPAFNAEHTIGRAVKSALQQSMSVREVIVIDDGSTDRTAMVAAQFPVRLIRQENSGVACARNIGAHHATGSWLAFLDADDQWHSRKLELQLQAISRDPEALICATRCRYQRSPEVWDFDPFSIVPAFTTDVIRDFTVIFCDPYLGTPGVVISRAHFERCGGFREDLNVAEDTDLWLRAAYDSVVLRLDCELVGLGRSRSSLTAQAGDLTYRGSLQVIEDFAGSHPEFAIKNSSLLRRVRSVLHTHLASEMLLRGEIALARREVFKAFMQTPTLRAAFLFVKSLLAKTGRSTVRDIGTFSVIADSVLSPWILTIG